MAIAAVDWREADHGAIASLYADEIGRWSGDARLGHCRVVGSHRARTAAWNGARTARARSDTARSSAGRSICCTGACSRSAASSPSPNRRRPRWSMASSPPSLRSRAQSVTVFVFTDAPGLASALACRGLDRRRLRLLDEAACQSDRREQPGTAPTERAGNRRALGPRVDAPWR